MTKRHEKQENPHLLVVITVSGGVADVLFKPVGVALSIFDYDVEGEERSSRDPEGEACSISEWPASERIAPMEPWPMIQKAIQASRRTYSRKWKCPLCGRTVQCSYEDLAEAGSPHCADCDTEMRLI